jgi:short-subunit dehydrogenase
MNQKIAVITGCSSGIGLHSAIEFAKNDYHVIATIRDINKKGALLELARANNVLDQIKIFLLDVTDESSLNEFKNVVNELTKIDVLINNAGFAQAGILEEIDVESVKEQFNTNVFGVISVSQLVLPKMRDQNSGKIINVSSISGKVGFPAIGSYVSSKHALEGLSESLRLEVKPFGIDVILVEPGSFQTNIWNQQDKLPVQQQNSPYKVLMEKIASHIKRSSATFEDPSLVGKLMVKLANKKRPKLRYTIGKGVSMMLIIKQLLPWRWWEAFVLRNLMK